jgi:catechol 2,3-dioxygenase-like lactoylglutathione lyase family enzyme
MTGTPMTSKETDMKLKNFLIVVKDIEKSKKYYHDLFGLVMVQDNGGNMVLTGGLVLQEEKYWKGFLGREITYRNNACELYFEEENLEAFVAKLERLYPETEYVNRLMTHSWGQKVVRFYDLDGNLIEVGTPMG